MRLRASLLSSILVLMACGPSEQAPVGDIPLGRARSAITVDEAVSAGCSTSQVEGLSLQIIAQSNCIEPDAFSELHPPGNVNFGSAVLPFLEEPARAALMEALENNPSTEMQVNSMLRTVAQQYLLYRWSQLGTCGVSLAATPGQSNHETGLAIDIQQYDTWRPILEGVGFAWLGESDPVHFDYVGPGAIDHRGLDVLAFQQLWNDNHPDDLIDEDGIYGPQTEGRIQQSPAEGFALGAECAPPMMSDELTLEAAFVSAEDRYPDGPSAGVVDLLEGDSYQLEIVVDNASQAASEGLALEVSLDEVFALGRISENGEPSEVAPGLDLVFDVPALDAGDSHLILLEVIAARYSVDQLATAQIAVDAAELGGVTLEADIYSGRRFTFDGGRREGWTSDAPLEIEDDALVLDTAADSPELSIPISEIGSISLSATREKGATTQPALLLALDGASFAEAHRIELALPADGERHHSQLDGAALTELGGNLTNIRFLPYGDDSGTAELHELSIEPFAGTGLGAEEEGCNCRTAPAPSRSLRGLWLVLGACLTVARRSARKALSSPRPESLTASEPRA